MAGVSAIGVNNDLSSGQPGVALRTTDLETSRRVHQQSVAVHLDAEALFGHPLQFGFDHQCADVRCELGVQVDVGGVMRRDHDGVQPHGPVTVVLDGHLGLAVRPQIGQ